MHGCKRYSSTQSLNKNVFNKKYCEKKTTTSKWACIINFKQLLNSQTLSPSFKYTHVSLKSSYKAHVKQNLMRAILLKRNQSLKSIYFYLHITCSNNFDHNSECS